MAETKQQQEKPKQQRKKRSPRVKDAALLKEVAEAQAKLEQVKRLAATKQRLKATMDGLPKLEHGVTVRWLVETYTPDMHLELNVATFDSPGVLEGNGHSDALG